MAEAADKLAVSRSLLYKFTQGHISSVGPQTARRIESFLNASDARRELRHLLGVATDSTATVARKFFEYLRLFTAHGFTIHEVGRSERPPTPDYAAIDTAVILLAETKSPASAAEMLVSVGLAAQRELPMYVLEQRRASLRNVRTRTESEALLDHYLGTATRFVFNGDDDLAVVMIRDLVPKLLKPDHPS